MEKLCRICNEISEHSVRDTGRPASHCKSCQCLYSQRHYRKNKEAHIKRSLINGRKKRLLNRKRLSGIKESHPCVDCGVSYPAPVMEFDHLSDKFKDVSMLMGYSWGTIQKEVAKCELVCANCHRIRTWKRSLKL